MIEHCHSTIFEHNVYLRETVIFSKNVGEYIFQSFNENGSSSEFWRWTILVSNDELFVEWENSYLHFF